MNLKKETIIGAVIIVVISFVLIAVFSGKNIIKHDNGTASGISFLKKEKEKSPEEVENEIRAKEREKMLSEVGYGYDSKESMDERLDALKADNKSVWQFFGDTVIMGDSRAVGFKSYEYLPDSHVLAHSGDNITQIEKQKDELKKVNPSRVYLCYGINDLTTGIWPEPDDYAKEYLKIIKNMQKEFPNVTFIVNSILPAKSMAYGICPAWEEIPEYNEALSEMCRKNGIIFVDCDDLVSNLSEYGSADGIHMEYPFYPYWGLKMVKTYYDNY